MRRTGLIALATLLGASASFGEDAVKAVFLPGTASEPAKVVFTDTKMVAAVVDAVNGQPPAVCPDGSFWTKDQDSLVSCKDGVTFKAIGQLVPGDKFYDLFAGKDAIKLLKVKGGTETDENPPMRSNQKKSVKP